MKLVISTNQCFYIAYATGRSTSDNIVYLPSLKDLFTARVMKNRTNIKNKNVIQFIKCTKTSFYDQTRYLIVKVLLRKPWRIDIRTLITFLQNHSTEKQEERNCLRFLHTAICHQKIEWDLKSPPHAGLTGGLLLGIEFTRNGILAPNSTTKSNTLFW